MKKTWLFTILLCSYLISGAQEMKTENIFLITLDGLRWQEVFTGADPELIANKDFVEDGIRLKKMFWRASGEARRKALLPFFWSTVAGQGQLYGNRQEDSYVNVTNPHWFSYPGYNEILTGHADKRINSNDKIPNPNRTVLDFISEQPGMKGKVAAFGSWDVFPYILNAERSDYPVNAGFDTASISPLTGREQLLNELLHEIPPLWSSVRYDAFTHHYAMEYLKKRHPQILYVAYGETDDFAHHGRYDSYLQSAHQTDKFIKELWDFAQSDPRYKGKTTFIITTDHGRGTALPGAWRSHGASVKGADEIWIAIIGPDTPSGKITSVKGNYYQNQVAETTAAFLGLDFKTSHETGPMIKNAFKKQDQ
ncbi:hypothetical protein EDD80_11317 [Anseongella ginsenosidimutans]|uniref:Phosphoglyceromutase n=1 Tax=Anseongella ginsenosidimutans TaxID=496056 RepID=A0A4R3KMZ6_9SPHI|nr:phosphoglyceromutase [Anseongella ginsenosidimutans]QEC52534.1 LTA synthase family protein [Anseongella ginsenosidimutans]TCS85282.1 hypothetical protein EDD80_11317 [Anseongella ginsenosidimutans]